MKRHSVISAAVIMVLLGLLSVGTAVLAVGYTDGYAEASAEVTTPDTQVVIHDKSGSADAYAEAKIGTPEPSSPPPDIFGPLSIVIDDSSGNASSSSKATAVGNSRADDDAFAVIENNSSGQTTAVSESVAIDNSYAGNETDASLDNYATGTAAATSSATATGYSEAGNDVWALIDGAGEMFDSESEPQDFGGGYASGIATAGAEATASNNSHAGNMVVAGIDAGTGQAYAEASATATSGSQAGSITQAIIGNYGPGNVASANSWVTADDNSRAGVISAVGIMPEGYSGDFTSYGIAMADGDGESLGISIITTGDTGEEFGYGDIVFTPAVSAYSPGVFIDVAGGTGGVAFAIVYVESLNKATTLTFTYGVGGDAAALAVIDGTEIMVDAVVGQGILDEFKVPGFFSR
jgi:hypothetical protein